MMCRKSPLKVKNMLVRRSLIHVLQLGGQITLDPWSTFYMSNKSRFLKWLWTGSEGAPPDIIYPKKDKELSQIPASFFPSLPPNPKCGICGGEMKVSKHPSMTTDLFPVDYEFSRNRIVNQFILKNFAEKNLTKITWECFLKYCIRITCVFAVSRTLLNGRIQG